MNQRKQHRLAKTRNRLLGQVRKDGQIVRLPLFKNEAGKQVYEYKTHPAIKKLCRLGF